MKDDLQDSETNFITLTEWIEQPIHSDKGKLSHRDWVIKVNQEKKDRIKSLCDLLEVSPNTIRNLSQGVYLPKGDVRQKIADHIKEPVLWQVSDGKFFVTFNNN